jgi:hypothetical protein
MPTRTGARPTGRSASGGGGRIAAGRGRAGRPSRGGRRGKAAPSGPMGLVNRVANTIGRKGGRGGSGIGGKATGFVQGFLSGGKKRRRWGR